MLAELQHHLSNVSNTPDIALLVPRALVARQLVQTDMLLCTILARSRDHHSLRIQLEWFIMVGHPRCGACALCARVPLLPFGSRPVLVQCHRMLSMELSLDQVHHGLACAAQSSIIRWKFESDY